MSFLRQAALVAVTAVVVAFVIPGYFKPSYPVPEIFGSVSPGFEEVKATFRQNYEENWDNREAGSAFSVYWKGEKVIDLWAGYADLEAKRLWREDTMTIIFSTTKGFLALCVGMLADRGLLDFKKPVAHYWPEFAQKGKEQITVEQLLEHEAGLYATDEPMSFEILGDHKKMDRILAETKPAWEPGTMHGYHAVTLGPYVDALVRRVDIKNRTIGQFFQEEVNKPFGIDAYIGLPRDLTHRLGRLVTVPATFKDFIYAIRYSAVTRNILKGLVFGGESAKAMKRIETSAGGIMQLDRFADPDLLRLELASANGVATARAVAKVYGILSNGGNDGQKSLLSHKIIDEYIHDSRGLSPDRVMYDMPLRWKYAMDVIPQGDLGNIFGASGLGGQVGYADPNNKLGYGFISRYMSPLGLQLMDPRFQRLQDSVLRAVEMLKN